MAAKPLSAEALRAAKLSRVPGVTIDEACKRFKVAKAEVQRARRTGAVEKRLHLEDSALAALTDNGKRWSGKLEGLSQIADWLSYVNQSNHTADEVRHFFSNCERRGELEIKGERWRLLKPWP